MSSGDYVIECPSCGWLRSFWRPRDAQTAYAQHWRVQHPRPDPILYPPATLAAASPSPTENPQ